jgi:hypothetical protein
MFAIISLILLNYAAAKEEDSHGSPEGHEAPRRHCDVPPLMPCRRPSSKLISGAKGSLGCAQDRRVRLQGSVHIRP